MDYRYWCSLSDDQLAELDIAEVNLECSTGLPNTEVPDIPACLQILDQWTERVRTGIGNALRNRDKYPLYDELSESEYGILTMYAVLYRHVGLTPNTDSVDPDFVFDGTDPRVSFIQAVLEELCPMTCAMAPVIFAAIGRRLGYPIKLVKSTWHLFCRWSDPDGERFNIEATNMGYYRHSDEHYMEWPKKINHLGLERGVLLTDLTPRQELALFVHFRGICFLWNLRPTEAIEAFEFACKLDPVDFFYRNELIMAKMFWHAQQESARRPGLWDLIPFQWRIPTYCRQWSEILYQTACERLDQIQDKRNIQRYGFTGRSRLPLFDFQTRGRDED